MANPPKKPARKSTRKPSATAVFLKGSRLADFEPLLPAEKILRQCVADNVPCKSAEHVEVRPNSSSRDLRIRGEFLKYLALGGCEKSPVGTRGITLIGFWIDTTKSNHRIDLQAADIQHDLNLFKCHIDGQLLLRGASTKNLRLDDVFSTRIEAGGINVNGNMFCRNGSVIEGTFELNGCNISGSLDLSRCVLKGNPVSISLDQATVGGSIFLNQAELEGNATLISAKVGRDIALTGSTCWGEVDAHNANIGENFWINCTFEEGAFINLRNARIGGHLESKEATFKNSNTAVSANRVRVSGDVKFGGITASGTIALTGAEIGGDFMPQDAELHGTPALQLRNAKVGGTLHWRGLKFVDGEVDLSGATCTTLNTGTTSWLRKRDKYRDRREEQEIEEEENTEIEYHTKLDNLTYTGFSNLPDNVKSSYWIEWLNQQPDDHLGKRFKPRPWEQLAKVLDSMGYEEEARDVRIEKQKLLTSFMINHEEAKLSWRSVLHWFQIVFRVLLWGPLVSYGYRPGNALLWLFLFVALGTGVYWHAAENGIMTPTNPLIFKEANGSGTIPEKCAANWVSFPVIDDPATEKIETCEEWMPSEYSSFNPFIYALDVALPVVNFRMEDDWAPRVVNYQTGKPDPFGWWIRTWEWFLIATGWILSLLFVSAVGSSIRR